MFSLQPCPSLRTLLFCKEVESTVTRHQRLAQIIRPNTLSKCPFELESTVKYASRPFSAAKNGWLFANASHESSFFAVVRSDGCVRVLEGWQHFYHQSASMTCAHAGESVQHLRMKAEAVRGALDAGWSAETEVVNFNAGWRADVLARHGLAQTAFEIQLSKIGLSELAERRGKFADSSVQDTWFVAASALRLGEVRSYMMNNAVPDNFFRQCPQPVFQLSGDNVTIDTVTLPLRRVVTKLLAGHFRCVPSRRVLVENARPFYRVKGCPGCGGTFQVYFVGNKSTTACNRTASGVLGSEIATEILFPLGSDFIAHIRAFIELHARNYSHLSFPRWFTLDSGRRYLGFRCAQCGYVMPSGVWTSLLKQNYSREEPSLRMYPLNVLALHRKMTISPESHWCHSSRSLFCDSREWIDKDAPISSISNKKN